MLNRVGEQNVNRQGLNMTIIEYINSQDITVQFEDGTLHRHKTYANFLRGRIKNPNYNKYIGLTKVNNNGRKMRIVEYDHQKITVMFDDGNTVKTTMVNYRKGTVIHPADTGIALKKHYENTIKVARNKALGTTRKMNCGLLATVIEYRRASDIDLQFEDGIIVKHKKMGSFRTGEIAHPNISIKTKKWEETLKNKKEKYKSNRLGHIVHSKKWGDIECIAYKNSNDFDLHFKKYDIIRRHCTNYQNFLLDKVAPSFRQHGSGQSLRLSVGDTQFNSKFNQTMTVIELGNRSRYKVQFEDGYMTPWLRNPGQFRSGNIHNPKAAQVLAEQKWLGQTTIARNGLKMTIIKVIGGKKDCKSIDVQFEDGAIVKNVIPAVFTTGEIKHPTLHANTIRVRKKLQDLEIQNINTGLTTKIIRYNSAIDFEVQFESGCIRRYTDISKFYDGTLPHPFPYSIGTVTMNKPAYIYQGEGNFYCNCNKCGISDIMNLSEIREHKCKV